MHENRSREMFDEIKDMTKSFQPRFGIIKDEHGKTLTETHEILDRWKRYCEEMFTDKQEKHNHKAENSVSGSSEDDLEPLESEVKWAIKNLKDGKSPGCDNIQAEMIRTSGEEGVKVYHKLCTKIWKTGQWPMDWQKAIFVPLPKKGDLQLCSNYRTISLISHASKILLKIIQKRLENKMEEEVNKTQAGFRRNRGTRDHIFNLRMIIQKFREVNRSLHICFIDYSKAFDCVKHNMLWQTLEAMNFNPRLIQLIKSLYERQQSAVRFEGETSEWFSIQKGVRQGCILSPHLFSLYTEDIMREVEDDPRHENYKEPTIQGLQLRDLRYADDTVLMSTTPDGLEQLINAVKDHSEKKGLMLNVKKTKIMDIDKCEREAKISVDDEQIERVNNFEYLGARFESNGKTSTEIRRRMVIAAGKLNKMSNIWKGQCITTKLRVLRSTIFPIATYGCEAWTLSKEDSKRITAFEMRCYRKILRVSWVDKMRNEEVLRKVNVPSNWLLNIIKKHKLQYFGHTKRHQTLEKYILEAKVEGKRGRGRPTRRWEQDVEEWMGMRSTEVGRLAIDRVKFRKAVWEATSGAG